MRFAAIRLSRYGHFEAQDFAFARADGAPDLHLVVGENEAGKTTLKNALVHFLFGIPARSSLKFRFDMPSIGAEVELGEGRLTLERGPGTKGLRPAEAAAPLASLLKGQTAETFLATQAFSHDDMREHSRLLQESKGDLKDLLMRDAGGLGEAVALLDTLKNETEPLFKKHKGARNTAHRLAEKAYDEAVQEEAGAALDADRYRGLIAARDRAEERLADLRVRLAGTRRTIARLESETRAEPIAARIAEYETRLATLPDVRLPENAVKRVNDAALAEAEARVALEGATERCRQLRKKRAGVHLDEAALAAAAQIEDVAKRLAELAPRARDRAARRDAAAAAAADAFARARAVGLPATDLETLAAALPAAVDRREADRRAEERAERVRAVEQARKALDDAAAETAPEMPEGPGRALLDALHAVAALGAYREDWRAAVIAVDSARDALAEAEEKAAGDEDCEAPPAPDEGVAAEKAIEVARRKLEAAEDRLQQASETVRARRDEARRAGLGEVPSEAALAAARTARDELWGAFVGGRNIGEAREDYERRVAEADGIADLRFDNTVAIVKAEAAEAELAAAEREAAERLAARDACREALEAVRSRWAERLAAAGLSTPPPDYRAWHERRRARREAARTLAAAMTALDGLRTRLRTAARACVDALDGTAGGDRPDLAALDLSALDDEALLRAVEAAAEAAESERARRDKAVSEAQAARDLHERRQRDRPRLEAELAAARAALQTWHESWRPLAARCGVPEDVDRQRLRDVLEGYEDIETALGREREARLAAEATDRFEAELSADVARLAERLGEAQDAGTVATGERLASRLSAARKAAETAAQLKDELDAATKEEERCAAAMADARRMTAADREAAGLAPDAPTGDLAEAADASDQRRALQARIREACDELAELEFGWPAARDTLAAMTGPERAAALDAARAEEEDLDRQVSEAVAEATRARGELERRHAESLEGRAARARFEAGVHARAMAEAAVEAIRRKLQVAVLSRARDDFEAQNRSPILDRASRIFAAFTGGAYDRLERGWASGQSFVRAHRVADDAHVDVTALSDGTRDQLVASIRLAAAEESPLPFIADDLFVNADDARAANGFRVLAGLAHGRQVIYLTHHAHLEAVALRAVGPGLSVVRL